jgi:glycosyltransferase involved in cell wall biosynthesis
LEIRELLESLVIQTYQNFEVIIVEDGSLFTCEDIFEEFRSVLDVSYHFVENRGQGFARNYGMNLAKGDYFVLFDSDCIIPNPYLEVLKNAIEIRKLDAHGGPDAAEKDFSAFQKAINYSMTSFLTTGGIRGKMKDRSKYQARGFNMGLSKKVFEATGGFIDPNRAEDIELSIRIRKLGFKLELVEEAFVYHKRKNTWRSFFKQSFSFGENRIHVSRFHPDAVKLIHLMPSFFLLGWMLGLVFLLFMSSVFLIPFMMYSAWLFLVFIDSSIKNRSILVGLISIVTSFGQLSFYGAGLIYGFMEKLVKEGLD